MDETCRDQASPTAGDGERAGAGDPDRTTGRLPPVRFEDVAVNRAERYSIGVEHISGRCYLSIPVTNGPVDYEEYYELDRETFEGFRADLDSALPFVVRCRDRQEDRRLMYQPGTRRGIAI